MRERSPNSSARCCCSAAARTRSCCCVWPRRRSRPAPFPFPLMHIDTGHNFQEAIEFRDRRVEEIGERLVVAPVEDSIRSGRAVEQTGPRASRNAAADVTLLDTIAEHGFDARIRRRAPRRGKRPGQGADPLVPRRVRPVGAPAPAPGGVEPLQWPHLTRASTLRVFPISNWTELDVWQYIARGVSSRCRRSTSRMSARSFAAMACCTRSARSCELMEGEEPFTARVRYRTVGDMSCTGAVESDADDARRSRRRDRRDRGHGARPDARGRPGHRGRDGGPQAARVLLMGARSPQLAGGQRNGNGAAARRRRLSRPTSATEVFSRLAERPADLLRFATAGSVDDGKSTLIGRLLYDSKQVLADQLAHVEQASQRKWAGLHRPVAAHRRPARRARAGHHDRRRLPLLRDRAAPLHHRRHPGPRAVHAQHGHRRVDRRPRDRARRRAQGRPRAVQAPRVHQLAARHPARGRVRQQDGPGRLPARTSSMRSSRSSTVSPRGWSCPTSRSSRSRRCSATTSSSARIRCPGTRARRCSTTSSTSTSPPTATSSTCASRCSG